MAPDEPRGLLGGIADSGIDFVFTADHVSFRDGSGMDGLVTLAAVGGLEPRLGLQVGVYLLALRHPMVAARQIATLAEAAAGRLTVGVGVGGDDRHEVEVCDVDPSTRGRRTDAALEIVRALLEGQTVDGDGEFFRFRGGRIRPVPDPAVPMVVGGRSDAALKRAGRLGDGWLAAWCSPRRFAEGVARVETAGAGRDVVPFVTGDHLAPPLGFLVVIIGEEILLDLFVHEAQAEIEPDVIRLIAFDDFNKPVVPAAQKGFARFVLRQPLGLMMRLRAGVKVEIEIVRLAVQAGITRIRRIVFRLPMGKEPPVFRVVHGDHEAHALGADRLLQLADHIALGPHLAGAPIGIAAIPHGEAIVMLGDRPSKSSARPLEELSPFIGVEVLGREHRDEVFVAKF